MVDARTVVIGLTVVAAGMAGCGSPGETNSDASAVPETARSAASNDQASTTTAPTLPTPAPTEPVSTVVPGTDTVAVQYGDELEVLSRGAEGDRVELTTSAAVGSTWTGTVMSTTVINQFGLPFEHLPVVAVEVSATATDAPDSDRVGFALEVGDAYVVDPGTHPDHMIAELEHELERIRGSRSAFEPSEDGTYDSAGDIEQFVAVTLDHVLPFEAIAPEEPVGVGARWRVIDVTPSGLPGVPINTALWFEFDDLVGEEVWLDVRVKQAIGDEDGTWVGEGLLRARPATLGPRLQVLSINSQLEDETGLYDVRNDLMIVEHGDITLDEWRAAISAACSALPPLALGDWVATDIAYEMLNVPLPVEAARDVIAFYRPIIESARVGQERLDVLDKGYVDGKAFLEQRQMRLIDEAAAVANDLQIPNCAPGNAA